MKPAQQPPEDRMPGCAALGGPRFGGQFRISLSVVVAVVISAGGMPVSAGDSGAENGPSKHWAFQRLRIPETPLSPAATAEELDRLVLSRLTANGLEFCEEADRRTLCRRLYLDLTGLPPRPSDVQSFVEDESPHAVERLVDQLLESPEYGERWGRQWLDVTGYADSNGYIRHDSVRPLAWRYRDYVIRSLNEDKPYDQFWREQLAGDELVNYQDAETLTDDQVQILVATHYLRNAPDGTDHTEGNEITRVMERYAVLEAVLQTTMSSMFGLTIDCARCHDHKFDPLSQQEYYSLQAVFYPAFNVKDWVQPKERWIHGAGRREMEAWKASQESSDQKIADLHNQLRDWILTHRPTAMELWRDRFDETSLQESWSAVAARDQAANELPLTQLDSQDAPGAAIVNGRLSIVADAPGDSRWLVTTRDFDWTPAAVGHWIEVSFELVSSEGPDSRPAERVGYYLALHDANDDSDVTGGNLLIDGNPDGGAGVVLDYPGSDQKSLGSIGTTGYQSGRRYGVRVTRTGEDEYLLEHVVDGIPETGSLTLSAAQLPDGGFGFELCCSRDFVVDEVHVQASAGAPGVPSSSEPDVVPDQLTRETEQRLKEYTEAVAEVNSTRVSEPPQVAWATDLSAELPEVRLLHRGDYFQPGDVVVPGPPAVLCGSESVLHPVANGRTTGLRLAFAEWATAPDSVASHLLARVQADRIWRGHFGKGLVPTPENFGVSGLAPTHPELLDWLAGQLIVHGWRQKAVHRMIVLSRCYRQSSQPTVRAMELDASNGLYSRFPAHRLEAEQIRDSMLVAAGALNSVRGGPAVEPVDQGDREIVLPVTDSDDLQACDRRSIYVRHRRSEPLTFLKTFDFVSPDPNCPARPASTVVSQSLAMLNGEFSVRMGQTMARRILREAAPDDSTELVRQAFQRAYSRDPADDELVKCREFLQKQSHADDDDRPDVQEALSDLCRLLLASNEFLYLP